MVDEKALDLEFNRKKKQTVSGHVEPVVSCELLDDALMREKLRPIIEYIKEGEPDINVVLGELEEIVSRSTGEYFKYNRCNSN